MTQLRLLFRLQRKIVSNYLRHEFATKTLVETAFGIFLLLATIVRFHRDIGFLWIHAKPDELISIFQNGLFFVFLLFIFSFQLSARKALRIPSGDVLLSLPIHPNALYFFRSNALFVRLTGWLILVLFFYLLAAVRFSTISLLEHVVQFVAVSLLLFALAEVLWSGVLVFQIALASAKTGGAWVAGLLVEVGLFFVLVLFRLQLLPFFHPERIFEVPLLLLFAAVFGLFFGLNRRLFRLALRKELHLKSDSRSKLIPTLGKWAGRLFFFFPKQVRALVNLEIQTQLRTNPAFKATVLIFGLVLLTGKVTAHSAADFIQDSLFTVLVLWIFLSAFFFGTQESARQAIAFYKSQPLSFAAVWLGRLATVLLIFWLLDAIYFLVVGFFYPGEAIPIWAVAVLFLFSLFLSVLQTNFHLTLLQNVRTGEYIYFTFWAVNWIFWFVFPFLPLVLLLAGAFAVRPARIRFDWMEETWSL